MIYVTGDTHIPIDVSKLNTENFPEQKQMTKSDYVIVLGDFGLYWKKNKTFEYWYKWLQEKPWTTLWLDGNHENHQWINSMEVTEWNGGKVHKDGHIIHLMRGQVYNIEEKTFFIFGGADSIDRIYRQECIDWWAQEVPNFQEINEGLDNLEKYNNSVDYVLTHTCPYSLITSMLKLNPSGINNVEKILQQFYEVLSFDKWYFGHWHTNCKEGKFECLYNNIVRLI